MRTIQTAFGAAAAVVLVVAAGSASAATTIAVSSTTPGDFSLSNHVGTIDSVVAPLGEVYDFTFTTDGHYRVDTQLQASTYVGGPEPISFAIYAGTPTSPGLLEGSTPLMTGPAIGENLDAGSYFIQTSPIAVSNELVSGGLKILAAPVPEPSAWALMLLGIGAIGVVLRRAKRKYGVSLADAFKAAPTV
jgi:hypothetical protein